MHFPTNRTTHHHSLWWTSCAPLIGRENNRNCICIRHAGSIRHARRLNLLQLSALPPEQRPAPGLKTQCPHHSGFIFQYIYSYISISMLLLNSVTIDSPDRQHFQLCPDALHCQACNHIIVNSIELLINITVLLIIMPGLITQHHHNSVFLFWDVMS